MTDRGRASMIERLDTWARRQRYSQAIKDVCEVDRKIRESVPTGDANKRFEEEFPILNSLKLDARRHPRFRTELETAQLRLTGALQREHAANQELSKVRHDHEQLAKAHARQADTISKLLREKVALEDHLGTQRRLATVRRERIDRLNTVLRDVACLATDARDQN